MHVPSMRRHNLWNGHTHARARAHVCTRMCMCVHVHTHHPPTCDHASVHAQTHAHAHTPAHMHMHTHGHTHTHSLSLPSRAARQFILRKAKSMQSCSNKRGHGAIDCAISDQPLQWAIVQLIVEGLRCNVSRKLINNLYRATHVQYHTHPTITPLLWM